MLIASLICFALAAVGGVVLAFLHRGEGEPPTSLALGHGALAATGLVLLIVSTVTGGAGLRSLAGGSIAAFVIAALGGFYLFSRRFVSEGPSSSVIIIHGGVAVIGFVLLVIFVI